MALWVRDSGPPSHSLETPEILCHNPDLKEGLRESVTLYLVQKGFGRRNGPQGPPVDLFGDESQIRSVVSKQLYFQIR